MDSGVRRNDGKGSQILLGAMRCEMFFRSKPTQVSILSSIIFASFDTGQALGQTHVMIGIVSPTFGHALFYVARDKGFYKAEGLIGEVIVMNWTV